MFDSLEYIADKMEENVHCCQEIENSISGFDGLIQDLVIDQKQFVSFKDVSQKLNVKKWIAKKALENYSKTSDKVKAFFVVSGTNGSDTKIFMSTQLDIVFGQFEKIDFHHM